MIARLQLCFADWRSSLVEASCYTRDGNAARELGRRINVGMVGINAPISVPRDWHGFSGWERSLFGDIHAYGTEGVRFYARQRSIMQYLPEST